MDARTEPDDEIPTTRKIYHAALNNDLNTLKELLLYHSLNEIDAEWLMTPGMRLAREGHTKAVDLLLTWDADLDDIALATASLLKPANPQYKQLKARVDFLRNELGADPSSVAYGAAMAGNFDYVMWLHKYCGASLKAILLGTGASDDNEMIAKVQDSIKQGHFKGNAKEKDYTIFYLAAGAARMGKAQRARQLFDEMNLTAETLGTKIFRKFVKYAAVGGCEELVTLLARERLYVSQIAHGLGMTERESLKRSLTQQGLYHDYDDHYFKGKVEGGHFKEINLHTEADDRQREILGALFRGKHYKKYDDLVLRYLNNKNTFKNLLAKTLLYRKYAHAGNLKYLLKLYYEVPLKNTVILPRIAEALNDQYPDDKLLLHKLVFTKDKHFLMQLKDVGEDGYIFAGDPALHARFSMIGNKALKILALIEKYKFDYDEALTFLDNRYLRKFSLLISLTRQPKNPEKPILPNELYYDITNRLSHLDASKTQSMMNKVTDFKYKLMLKHRLTKYSHRFWVNHKERATSLLTAIDKTNSTDEIVGLLDQQLLLKQGKSVKGTVGFKHEKPVKNKGADEYWEIIKTFRN